jgi:hypothetical protein
VSGTGASDPHEATTEFAGARGPRRQLVVTYRTLICLAGAGLLLAGVAIAVGSPTGLRSALGVPGTLLLPGLLLSLSIFPPRTIDAGLRWVLSIALSLAAAMAVGLAVVEIAGRVSARGVGVADMAMALLLVWPAVVRANRQRASISVPRYVNRGVPVLAVSVAAAVVASIVLMRAPAPGSNFLAMALVTAKGSVPVVQIANRGTSDGSYLMEVHTRQDENVLTRVVKPAPGAVLEVSLDPVANLKSGTRVFVQLSPPSGSVIRRLSFYVQAGQTGGTAAA